MSAMSQNSSIETTTQNQPLPEWARLVRGFVDSINFGVVQIVVQDRKVIHIEKKEKLRIDPNS
jgi:hypothetical protein